MKTKLIYSDAQMMAKLYPDTFEAPSIKELNNLKVGDYVKVCIDIPDRKEDEPESERFWCDIKKIDGDKIIGSVGNDLIYLKLKYGKEIEFLKRNVYSIIKQTI